MKAYTYLFALAGILFLGSCDKDDNTNNANNTTLVEDSLNTTLVEDSLNTMPVVDSLTTSISVMPFGSTKPAVLNCYATGGNLIYIWEVDLGDLFVINNSGSQAQYSASPCCIGEKIISCTVSNNKGEVVDYVMVTITE